MAAEAPPKKGGDPIEALEKQMAALLNRDRATHKLPPLTYHKGLAAVARAHSQDMHDHNFFAHKSKRTGNVDARVARARIPFRAAGENIVRAPNAAAGQKWLMLSKKHRANILSGEFTHLGVGIVRPERGWLICTQVFIRPPPVYDVEAVRKQIVEGINKARLAKGLRRLLADDVLTKQALSHSQRAAKLGRPAPLWLEDKLAREDNRWRIHQAVYLLTDKPDDAIFSDVALSPRHDHFGVGVVQAPRGGKGAGALWVTLICAQKK